MRFLVVGTGGVGGFFGAKLALAGNDVWFIARGRHLAAMKRSGLRVHSSEGDFHIPRGTMTDDPAHCPRPDVILFCVKRYQTESACRLLAPILTRNSIILTLQNGIDAADHIRHCCPTATVFSGAAYIFSTITEPGVIKEWGSPRKIIFGPENGRITKQARSMYKIFQQAAINCELTKEIRTELWKKFIFIAAGGGVMTLTRLRLDHLLANNESRILFVEAMKEAVCLAQALHISLPDNFLDSTMERLQQHKNATYTSMYFDLKRRRPLELEALAGTIVRLGKELGIPTPVNRTVYASLLPHHERHCAREGISI